MSFVAANWEGMSRVVRLVMLACGMWAAYAAAAVFFTRSMPTFADAAVLTGTAIFGASIMLVAQMYHMEGNPPDAVLLWGMGAFVAGLAFQSGPALALTMILAGLWSAWEMQLTSGIHWAFLGGWTSVAAAFLWLRWRPGLHLSALALSGWIVALADRLPHGPHFWLVAAIGFVIAVASALAQLNYSPAFDGRIGAVAPTATNYGLALGFTGLLLMQFARNVPLGTLAAYAIVTLLLVVAAIGWALHTDNRPALWVTYAAFSAEILALYFRTLGTLINTSFFFASAGVLVIGLASIAFKLAQRQQHALEGAHL